MKRSISSTHFLQVTAPCAPLTHQWTRSRITGVQVCLLCGARAYCPLCRRESIQLLSVGTWIIVCPSCIRAKQEQQMTHAGEEGLR